MKIAIELDSLSFVLPENPLAAARSITMRRNDVLPIELLVFKGGNRHELSDDDALSIQLNDSLTFGGTGLASSASFSKIGSGFESVYQGTLDLSGAAVTSAFSGAQSFVLSALEVKVTGGALTQRTEPLSVRLQNSIS